MKNNSIQSGKRSLQSLLILLLLFINNFQALSSSYYVNSNNGSDINTGSENSAWKTLKPLNSMLFKPGDQVLFACTSNFTGGFTINGTGSDLSLIHISEPTRLGMISYAVFCLK